MKRYSKPLIDVNDVFFKDKIATYGQMSGVVEGIDEGNYTGTENAGW